MKWKKFDVTKRKKHTSRKHRDRPYTCTKSEHNKNTVRQLREEGTTDVETSRQDYNTQKKQTGKWRKEEKDMRTTICAKIHELANTNFIYYKNHDHRIM